MAYFFAVSDESDPTTAEFGVGVELDDAGLYRLYVEDDPHVREERFADLDGAIDAIVLLWPEPRYTVRLRRA